MSYLIRIGTGELKPDSNYPVSVVTRHYFNYFCPDYTTFENYNSSTKYEINNSTFISSPSSKDFASNETLTFKNSTSSIENF